MRILIADDDLVTRVMLKAALSKWGYDVLECGDGSEAFRILREPGAPQLALVDWTMPGMTGPELCARLRQTPDTASCYLILLTSRDSQLDVVAGLNAGADDHIAKPHDNDELRARLNVGCRIVGLQNELRQREEALRQHQDYLKTIMDTVQAGLLVCELNTGRIHDANPVAEGLLGLKLDQLRMRKWEQFFQPAADRPRVTDEVKGLGADVVVTRADGQTTDVHLTRASVRIRDTSYEVLSFVDLSDLQRLLKAQRLNIEQARRLHRFVNDAPPSRIDLAQRGMLVVRTFSQSAQAAGGDHCFIRTRSQAGDRAATVVSLCDQSGHEINCILRSIVTDLSHQTVLDEHPESPLEFRLEQLNDRLCGSGLFQGDEYLTALTLEIDHETRSMRYLSCGHPPMLVVRKGAVVAMPEPASAAINFPLGSLAGQPFQAGSFALEAGDQVLLYTDGLTEMMLPLSGTRLSTADLVARLEAILRTQVGMPVGRLMAELLRAIAAESGVRYQGQGTRAFPDDVSVVGLEIEPLDFAHRIELYPRSVDEVTDAVERITRTILGQWPASQKTATALRVVLEEALYNAWQHGNRCVPGERVRVQWRIHNDLVVEVADSGPGFDHEAVADPRAEENLLKETGRGVFLIKARSDFCRWLDGGSRLIAAFPLE